MNEIFTDFSLRNFNFERFDILIFVLLAGVFILLEIFPGRRLSFPLIKLRRFIDEHLIRHLISTGEKKRRLYIRTAIAGLVWVLLILALGNPRWDYTEIEAFKPNINLIFLTDISKSMDAQDEKPSRIERAKQEIKDIVKNISGVNYGLVVFAEQASVISPLTDDKSSIEYYLPSISTDLVGVQGSNIKAGVDTAVNMLSDSEGSINYIVLMTDGGFQNKNDIEAAKQKLQNIKIFSFAFGTQSGAPLEDADGSMIREKGRLVISRIEPENLIELCGKDYVFKSTYLDDDVMKLKSYIDKDISAQQAKYQSMRVWNDRFYLPLILAMIILALFFRKGSVFPMVILLLPMASGATEPKKDELEYLKFDNIFSLDMFRNEDQKAYNRFKKGKYDEAYEKFSSDYNKGVAAYKLKDFAKAEEYFLKDNSLESLYNLGNAQISQLKAKEAIETYEKVLKQDPANPDAKFNLELAKKLLKEQSRQQEQNKNNQPQIQSENQQNPEPQEQYKKDGDDKNNESDSKGKASDDFKNAEVNPVSSGLFGDKVTDKNFNNQLKIDAQKMFSKISGNPKTLIQNRIMLEQGNKKTNKQNIKPW